MKKFLLTLFVLGIASVSILGCKAEGEVGDPDKMSTSVAPF
jgi:hypothetical protein